MIAIQRLRRKYPLLDNTVPAPEATKLEGVNEEFEEEIVYKPPVQGCFTERGMKITLEAFMQEYYVVLEVNLCSII